MSKPITGKISTSTWRQKRPNGDIYVWQRQTRYIAESKTTEELHRKLLGKIPAGSTDGKIVPTRSKRKPQQRLNEEEFSLRHRVGATDLLRWVGKKSGISEDLLSCMDEDDARKIDTIAQFWLANQGDRLQRIQKWQLLHPTPFDGLMTKDTYHDLFVRLGLGEHRIQNYFRARAARCHKGDAIAFDSSTISSYSRHIHEVRQGFNKAGDGLDTVKLLSLYDLQTHQPIAFARQPGNLSDVAAIENTLKQLRYLNISKAQIVTDRGYYSQDNMAQMFDKHMKFLTAVSIDLRWINKTLQENKPRLETACSLCPWDYKIHGYTVPIRVNFNRIRSCQSQEAVDPTVESHRLYVHLYLNRERVADDERRLAADLMELKHDIELGRYEQLSETARKKADKYLTQSTVGRGGRLKVTINEEAYARARDDYGYFALVSNKAEGCFDALRKYRLREKIEEAFKDSKNRMDGCRTRVWDGDVLKGRLFCQFVALGYYCYLFQAIGQLKKDLEKSLLDPELSTEDKEERKDLLKWLRKQSMQSLIDWLDCIELTTLRTDKGNISARSGDTKRDRLFFRLLGVEGYGEKHKAQLIT